MSILIIAFRAVSVPALCYQLLGEGAIDSNSLGVGAAENHLGV